MFCNSAELIQKRFEHSVFKKGQFHVSSGDGGGGGGAGGGGGGEAAVAGQFEDTNDFIMKEGGPLLVMNIPRRCSQVVVAGKKYHIHQL